MAKLNKANKPTFQGFQEISALKMVDKSSTSPAPSSRSEIIPSSTAFKVDQLHATQYQPLRSMSTALTVYQKSPIAYNSRPMVHSTSRIHSLEVPESAYQEEILTTTQSRQYSQPSNPTRLSPHPQIQQYSPPPTPVSIPRCNATQLSRGPTTTIPLVLSSSFGFSATLPLVRKPLARVANAVEAAVKLTRKSSVGRRELEGVKRSAVSFLRTERLGRYGTVKSSQDVVVKGRVERRTVRRSRRIMLLTNAVDSA